MTRELEDITINNDSSTLNNNYSEFYPFYIIKNRRSISSRRSSLQSWQQRHRFRLVRRLVRKSGKSSIHQKTSTHRSYRFFLDLSNTLIESSWIWTLLVLSLAFVMTWLMFAGFWAIISIDSLDTWNGTSESSCLEGINSFAGYLLFSIETQTTIGYGGRYIKENCPEAVIGLCIQLIIGVGVGGSLISIVFLKMGGPLRNRNPVDCFSKKAVICQRDGEFCLIFRVRDYDMRYECHTKIVAYLVEKKRGELSLKVLKLEKPGVLIWPMEVVHKIDSASPFRDLSAKDLIITRFEIVVVMEGASLATSYMSRTTTSYLNREIKWGHKFKECTVWDKKSRKYVVNHKLFNTTEETVMPLCSAQRFFEVYDDIIVSQSATPYAGSIFSESSKFSSPSSMSPLIRNSKEFRSSNGNNENYVGNNISSSDDEVESTRAVVSAEIHYRPKKDDDRSEYHSSSSSDGDAFMDLSIENLTERRVRKPDPVEIRVGPTSSSEVRPRTLSGQAKDFLVNLQKYVTEGSGSKNRSSRKYEETSF